MSFWQHLSGIMSARQDYAWFLTALGWLAVATVAYRVPTNDTARAVRPWLLWTAAGGLGVAAIELWLGVNPPQSGMGGYRPWIDGALVICGSLGIIGLVWVGGADAAGRRGRLPALCLSLLAGAVICRLLAPRAAQVWYQGLLFERGPAPFLAASLLALVETTLVWLVVVRWRRQGWEQGLSVGVRRWERAALAVIVIHTVVCTSGPIAEGLGLSRRWGATSFSSLGMPSAVLQLGAALALGFFWWRWQGGFGNRSHIGLRREFRLLTRVTLVWLALGLGLAEWAAHGARTRFEASLLSQSRLAAMLFDRAELAQCLGPRLVLGPPAVTRQRSGRTVPLFETPFAMHSLFDSPRKVLLAIGNATPGVTATVATLRQDRLIVAIARLQPGQRVGRVAELRRANEADLAAWRSGATELILPDGEMLELTARSPLLSPDGEMLGWLHLSVGMAVWASSQAQARLLTFSIVGLGVVLALLIGAHRWRAMQHEEARRAAHEAAAAERAKTDFLAKVSHELRTPAQSMLGYTQLMESSPLNTQQRAWLAALHGQTELMIRLVGDLLDLSALQMGAFRLVEQPTAMKPMLNEVVESFRQRAATKGIALSYVHDENLPPVVSCDSPRVRQVLLNLVGNAVKFTARGHVEVRSRRLSDLACPAGTAWCEVAVTDTGPGISPEDQKRLFQPFIRLDNAAEVEGAGLGLSLAAGLVRSMGGLIEVESDGCSGTTFRVRWLLCVVLPAQTATVQLPGPDLSARRILVADDNPLIRELLSTYFAALGADVQTVADGETACERGSAESFDTIILDISLPKRNGFEAARDLRRRTAARADLRIIALSAHANLSVQARATQDGFNAFFTKPADLRALAAAVCDDASPVVENRPVTLPPELREHLDRQFRQEIPGCLENLHAALEAFDWERVERVAHYLAGSASVIQSPELIAAAGQLEQAAERENYREAKEALRRVDDLSAIFCPPGKVVQ